MKNKLLSNIKGKALPKHDRSSQCTEIVFNKVKTVKGIDFGYALATDIKGGQVILSPIANQSKPRFYREFIQSLDEFQDYMIGNNLNIGYKHCLSLRLWEKSQSLPKQKAIRQSNNN